MAMKPTKSMLGHREGLKIEMVMTHPRVGFMETAMSAVKVASALKIPMRDVDGAYFDKGMEGLLRRSALDGFDYTISVDYDSVFSENEVLRLIALAEQHPEADAIAALQSRRENDMVLAHVENVKGPSDIEHPIVPARSAHFGLTIFRCKAFDNPELPNPLMIHQPGENGYGDGCVDADVAFWRSWTAAGNTLFIAPRVSVGHIEMMVTWPSEGLASMHQRLSDYRTVGKPAWARH